MRKARKMSVLLSVTVLAALLLAACAGGNNAAEGNGANGGSTQAPGQDLSTPIGGGDGGTSGGTDSGLGLETPTGPADGADGALTGTPQTGGQIPQTGADVTGTPMMDLTGTPMAGDVTGTPMMDLTGTPMAGDVTGTPMMDLTGTPAAGVITSTPLAGTTSTPLAGTTSTPMAGTTSTPMAGTTSTPMAGTTSTPMAGADLTQTPQSGSGQVPPPGGVVEDNNRILLSDVLGSSINGLDGQPAGNVAGLVINSGVGEVETSSDDATASGNPPAGGVNSSGGAASGANDSGGASGATTSGNNDNSSQAGSGVTSLVTPTAQLNRDLALTPQVTLEGAGAINTPAPTIEPGGLSGGFADATATPQGLPGDTSGALSQGQLPAITHLIITPQGGQSAGQVLVPWQAFTVDSQTPGALTLSLSVDAAALSGAPQFSQAGGANADQSAVLAQADQYWSGQGVIIPQTGGATGEQVQPLIIQGQIGSLPVTGPDGQGSLGQVRDFVVDAQTGELIYAILGGGSGSQGQLIVVPAHLLSWDASQPGQGQGRLSINATQQALQGAPAVGSVDELDLTAADFGAEYDAYWSTQVQ